MIAEEKKIWKIREQLEDLTEENYKDTISAKEYAFLRPLNGGYSKWITDKVTSEYLNEAGTMLGEASYHEEFMVWGLVIAYIKADRSEVERHLDEFVPKINNWAVCDSCVTSYKFMQKESDFWFDYVKKYAESKNEFELRFMIVSLMSHFLDKEHIDEILTICGKIDHDGYYVKMGNAWALSVCYVKFPEKTRAFLEKDTLDDFTHNKAIQKIRESYRVSKEEKEQLTCLKR